MTHRAIATAFALLILAVPLGGASATAAPGASQGCSTDWTVVKAARPDRGISLLWGVSVISATDAWAAGDSLHRDFSNQKPLFEHWDGTAWSVVPSPSLGGDGAIGDIAAVASDDVWAVGHGPSGVLVEHWDGTAWHVVPAPSSNVYSNLVSLSATSADDVWAAGTAEHTGARPDPLVEHWNGSAGGVEPVPASPKQAEQLVGVTAISPTDVWAVGQAYPGNGVFTGTLALHWDSVAWTRVDTPNPAIHGFDAFDGVTGISAHDVWAVGTTRHNEPLAEHWDGTRWAIIPVSVPDGEELNRVAAAGPTDVRATGVFPLPHPVVLGWNGPNGASNRPRQRRRRAGASGGSPTAQARTGPSAGPG